MEPFAGNTYLFANGGSARVADWEDLNAVTHTQRLFDTPWSVEDGRAALSFYDSTEEYMRNDWAMENLPVRAITDSTGGETLVFQWPRTGTWHTIDAFDIDHIVPAVQHAENLGADNLAEANIAYNDIGNLRLLPSAANRSGYFNEGLRNRDPPDGWVEEKFGFDSTAARPMSQPVNRSDAMYEKPWSLEDDGRRSLSFDDDIRTNWFESRLHDIHVGDAEIDGRAVPLFECEATGQLVTRDALDIDHRLPIDGILRRVQPTNKGDALDLYNDRTNLRLVSRSANSSGDWELTEDGEFRDGRKRQRRGDDEDDEEQPGEFDDFIEEGGDPAPEADMAEIRGMLGSRMRPHGSSGPQSGSSQPQRSKRGRSEIEDDEDLEADSAAEADPALSASSAASASDAGAASSTVARPPVRDLGTFGRRTSSQVGGRKRRSDGGNEDLEADSAADADPALSASRAASASDAGLGTSTVAEGAADASLAADAGEILEVGALLLL